MSLGAVRLKIIDLEQGDQPMASDDGNTILVFNGELYNHLELRRELEQAGHRFNSRCDTETVLHAFLEWDTDAFCRFRGMFAAAFWTQSEKRLVLVRDHMGIKPLYFARRRENVYFGSELKTILPHPEIGRSIDLAGLADYLSLNYVPGPRTLVEGVEKVPPGTWLEWRAGTVSRGEYWRLEFHPDQKIDLPAAKEELDELLCSAVNEQLASDVPLGVWSSGGLDSSTVLHYASQKASGRLKTFSVSFQGRKFDESRYFREVAQCYGTDHHEFDLNPDTDLAGVIEEIPYYSDEPSADAGALPVWFLSQMCRRHVTVALSGDGADELFGGYKTYLADRYSERLRRLPPGVLRFGEKTARMLPVSDEKIGLDYKINRLLQGSLLDPMEAHFFWNGTFSRAEQRDLRNGWDVPVNGRGHGRRGRAATGLSRFMWMDQVCYLPDDILAKVDRMSMAHSLEVRPPFLDHRIVEFAGRLPENLKIRGGSLKFVLRELMKDRLPRTVVKRRKEGFDIPTHHWFRTILRPLLLETLNEQAVRESGILSWPAVDAVVRAHLERRANLGYHLWGLVVLFLWMKQWGMTAPSHAELGPEMPVGMPTTA
ncbi:MAG: asparagine synthase (glutamine-hydrolyzing) [Bryobacterales bacterium]|nr:asparagine synthase (glutamine-hydrolyzing) [Bryobacterales bacterium]